jgi:hypothetical protein
MSEGKRRKKRFQAFSGQLQVGGATSKSRGDRGPNPCKVFVANISFQVSGREMKEFFADFGAVKYCQIVKDQNGRSRGIGFVTFKSVDAVESVLSATDDQLILDGRTLRVDLPSNKKRQKAVQEVLSNTEGGVGCDIGEGVSKVTTNEELDGDTPQSLPASQEAQSLSIPELNHDVLLLIIRHLDLKDRITVERVSKKWFQVARISWQYVHHITFKNIFCSFQGKYGGLSDDILHSVLKRGCKNLTSLDLSSSPQFLTEFGIDLIGMYCTRLERLDLSGVPVSQTSIRKLSQRCANLKWLKVSGSLTVGEKCVWWGLHNWKQLQYLNISDNVRINGQCFYMAGSILRHVHLQCCRKLTDSSLELLAARCPHLETLDISHCSKLTGAALRSLTQVGRQVYSGVGGRCPHALMCAV